MANEELDKLVLSQRETLKFDAKDDELARIIDDRIDEANKKKVGIDNIGKTNENYWGGKHLDLSRFHRNQSKIVDNRVFAGMETILPALTANVPAPQCEGKINPEKAEKIYDVLTIAYEIKYLMPQLLRVFIRNWMNCRLGVMKYRWDKKYGFKTEVVHTSKVGFDPICTSLKDCDFAYEYMEDNVDNLIKKFPDKEKEIIKRIGEDKRGSKIRYVEFWGDGGEWVAWKMAQRNGIILDKKKNPNFDYSNKENNLFPRPKFPYIIGNYFRTGTGLYDETSIVEQALPLQDGINKRKQQISDLTNQTKRCWVVSSEAATRKEFQKFVDETGDYGFWLDGGDVRQFQMLMGGVDHAMLVDLDDSKSELDNIMGTHQTFRGERTGKETATGRQLLLEGDLGRLSPIVEDVVEQVVEEWYGALLHMHKVMGKSIKVKKDDTMLDLKREDIPNKIKIMVKRGTAIPRDRQSRAEMAIQLAQIDKIDPETLFEELGYPNAKQRTEALISWLTAIGAITPFGSPAPGSKEDIQAQQAGMPQGGMPQGGQPQPQPQPEMEQGLSPEDELELQRQIAQVIEILQEIEKADISDEEKAELIGKARAALDIIKAQLAGGGGMPPQGGGGMPPQGMPPM